MALAYSSEGIHQPPPQVYLKIGEDEQCEIFVEEDAAACMMQSDDSSLMDTSLSCAVPPAEVYSLDSDLVRQQDIQPFPVMDNIQNLVSLSNWTVTPLTAIDVPGMSNQKHNAQADEVESAKEDTVFREGSHIQSSLSEELRPCHIHSLEELEGQLTTCMNKKCCRMKYHCPVCPVEVYKPTTYSKIVRHLKGHWRISILYQDIYTVRCYHPCLDSGESHWHCPCCDYSTDRRVLFLKHLEHRHGGTVGTGKVTSTKPPETLDTVETDAFLVSPELPVPILRHSTPEKANRTSSPKRHDHNSNDIASKIVEAEKDVDDIEKLMRELDEISDDFRPMNESEVDLATEQSENERGRRTVENPETVVEQSHPKPRECRFCHTVLPSFKEYSDHLRKVHNTTSASRSQTVCELCGLSLRVRHLKTHIEAVHNKNKPHTCPVCSKSFSQKNYLKIHVDIHKPENERRKPHECPACGKRFAKKGNLNEHMNLHSKRRPYSCTECKKTFPCRSALRKHSNVHSDETCLCYICDKQFKSKDYLKSHIANHPGLIHPCHTCGRSFPSRDALNVHCSQCGAFVCEICGEEFETLEKTKLHIIASHVVEVAKE